MQLIGFDCITAKLAGAENLIGAAQRQINPAPGITKFKTQILSVLITHANTILIAQSAKYGSVKCK